MLAWPDPVAWQLRISLAEVDKAGPFSAYPGVERWFAVTSGAGVILELGEDAHTLDVSSQPLRFDGALPARCTLRDGPTRDLNLMTSAASQGRMLAVHGGIAWECALPQRGIFTRVAGTWSGGTGAPIDLAPDTLLWCEGAALQRFVFHPHQADARFPGWWLGFSPDP